MPEFPAIWHRAYLCLPSSRILPFWSHILLLLLISNYFKKAFYWIFVRVLLLFSALVFWPQGMWDPSSVTRDGTHTPLHWRRSLNHWTTKEVPSLTFFLFLVSDNSHRLSVIFWFIWDRQVFSPEEKGRLYCLWVGSLTQACLPFLINSIPFDSLGLNSEHWVSFSISPNLRALISLCGTLFLDIVLHSQPLRHTSSACQNNDRY